MTDLWYIKRNDFLRFETLKCRVIVLQFTRNFVLKFHYFLPGPLIIIVIIIHIFVQCHMAVASFVAKWYVGCF